MLITHLSVDILGIKIQLALLRHPLTEGFKLPSRQFKGNRLAVFPAVDRGKAHAQLVGQFFLAEPELLADLFDRLRKIFRCLCHIGLPQFLVRHQFTDCERT